QVMIHARVLIGMYGDGTIDGTRMVFIDPADGQRHEKSFLSFQQSFEQVAMDVRRDRPLWIQVVHNAARMPAVGQALESPRRAVARLRSASAARGRGSLTSSTSTLAAQPGIATFFDAISKHVQASPLVGHQWTCGPQTRGQAPIGYLKGMALSYARVYHMYTDPDRLQAEMRHPLNPNPPPEQHLQRDRFVVSMARGVAPGASTITDA